jgi:hypothetical protein
VIPASCTLDSSLPYTPHNFFAPVFSTTSERPSISCVLQPLYYQSNPNAYFTNSFYINKLQMPLGATSFKPKSLFSFRFRALSPLDSPLPKVYEKKGTLSSFRINTYKKPGEGYHRPKDLAANSRPTIPSVREHFRPSKSFSNKYLAAIPASAQSNCVPSSPCLRMLSAPSAGLSRRRLVLLGIGKILRASGREEAHARGAANRSGESHKRLVRPVFVRVA